MSDTPNTTPQGGDDRLARRVVKQRRPVPPDPLDLRAHVVPRLGVSHGFEVAPGHEALAERIELGAGKPLLQ